MRLSLLYVIFSIIAIAINLLVQETVVRLHITNVFQLEISIFTGTLVGLIIKYVLDKRYIFYYHAESQIKDAQAFLLYSIMGIVTTLIFWAVEFAFDTWFATKTMRYVGAIIGLTIGYITKYQLDKRFVFSPS